MRPCYAFTAAAGKKPATISVFEEIGFWGTQAKDFVAQLNAVAEKDITVEINSPGGDVFAALTMYNSLRASGKAITTKVLGVAASAASLLFLAGDKREMPKNTQVMAHNPWTVVAGNADDLEETAATLRKIGASIAHTYAARTGLSDEAIGAILGKDTWMNADEALANGFATDITDEIKVNAKFDLARADLPEAVKIALGLQVNATDKTPEEIAADEKAAADLLAAEAEAARLALENQEDAAPIADQVNALAVNAGMADFAPAWVVACTTVAQAESRIASAREITAICAHAKRPDDAKAFIAANKTVVEARTALATAMAKTDEDNPVDGTPRNKHKQNGTGGAPKAVNTASIWASHNAQTAKKKGS